MFHYKRFVKELHTNIERSLNTKNCVYFISIKSNCNSSNALILITKHMNLLHAEFPENFIKYLTELLSWVITK